MTTHRRLRIAVVAIVGAVLTASSLTACGDPHPDISVTSVNFVSSTGAYFAPTRRGASFVLPSGIPGEVRVTFTSEVSYGTCTLDFDGRAQLPVTPLPEDGTPQKPQMVSKRTGALVTSSKVPGTLTCAQQKAGSIPESSSFVASIELTPMISASPPSVTFAPVAIGESSPAVKVTLTSTGSGPARIFTLSYPRETFVMTHNGCDGNTLKVGARCSFYIAFTPQKETDPVGGAVIINLANESLIPPQPIFVTGAIDRGEGKFTPSSDRIDFGAVQVGTSADRMVTITNSGTGPLYIKRTTLASEVFGSRLPPDWPLQTSLGFFTIAEDRCSGTTVAAGGTCQVRLAYAPPDGAIRPDTEYLVFLVDETVTWNPFDLLVPADAYPHWITVTGSPGYAPQPQPTSEPQPGPHG